MTHPSSKARRSFAAALTAAVLVLSVFASSASACPNCKNNLPNGKTENGATAVGEPKTAQGYAWSIYLMLIVPAVLVTGLGTTAFVLVRKASARAARLNHIA